MSWYISSSLTTHHPSLITHHLITYFYSARSSQPRSRLQRNKSLFPVSYTNNLTKLSPSRQRKQKSKNETNAPTIRKQLHGLSPTGILVETILPDCFDLCRAPITASCFPSPSQIKRILKTPNTIPDVTMQPSSISSFVG
jgi:hypothetical protein